MQFVILQIQESDIKKILDIQTECHLSGWTTEEYREEFKKENSIMLAAKFKGETVGFLSARLSKAVSISEEPKDFAELDILNFGVAKKYQKQGIGRLLLENLINKIAGMNVKSVWLEVRESNVNAINFYKKKGFLEIQIRKNFYRQPLENAILMKLDLQTLPSKF